MGHNKADDIEPDILAYQKAARRAEASQLVADERFSHVVALLHEDKRSIRKIAAVTGRPKSSVARALVSAAGPLERRRGEVDPSQYGEAHNAAWSHWPSAQRAIEGNTNYPQS